MMQYGISAFLKNHPNCIMDIIVLVGISVIFETQQPAAQSMPPNVTAGGILRTHRFWAVERGLASRSLSTHFRSELSGSSVNGPFSMHPLSHGSV
jgi:hypothetical protein